MDSIITKAKIDECREALKKATPYSDDELCTYDGKEDAARRKATYAKDILEHFGLSLTDPTDYGNISE